MNTQPFADSIIAEVLKCKPMHRRFLKNAMRNMTDTERSQAERYIGFMISEGFSIGELASAYLLIVDDTFKETLRFQQTGRYRFSTFEETRSAVYDNAEYMRAYMLGLALSSFWWLNHIRLRRFFLQQLPGLAEGGGLYREVGPGHGLYFVDALRTRAFDRYEGVDISATSIGLTGRMLHNAFDGAPPPARLIQSDFLQAEGMTPCRVLVMGEVLEHVEAPGAFLQRAFDTSTADARVFLTTCVNAPAIDHLFNPGSIAALEGLFDEHGFVVQASCAFGTDERSIEECERDRLAVNVGYVLAKKR